MIINILSTLITFVIVKQKWCHRLFDYLKLLKWFQYLAILCVLSSSMLLLFSSEYILGLINNYKISMLFYVLNCILFCTIIAGIIWLVYGVYKTDYYTRQNKVKDEIINAQQKYYRDIYENDKENVKTGSLYRRTYRLKLFVRII